MWQITRKMMRSDLGMMVPAGIAIVIGTLFIAMTFLFGNTMDISMRRMVSSDAAQANYAIIPKDDDRMGQMTVKDFKTKELAAVPGVRAVRSDANFFVDVRVGTTKADEVVAIPSADADLMPVALVQGSWPAADDQVVLPRPTASRLKLAPGDRVNLNLSASMLDELPGSETDGSSNSGGVSGKLVSRSMTVSGISADQGGMYDNWGGAIVLTPRTSDALMADAGLGGMGNLIANNIYLVVSGQGDELNGSLASLRKSMPSGYALKDRSTLEEGLLKNALGGQQNFMTTFLLTFGILAMFVAATVIANTFQVMVARQRRQLALLRIVGAKRVQIQGSVLIRSAVLGILSSLIGIGAAIGIMVFLEAAKIHMNSLHFQLSLTPPVILVPLIFGAIVTVLASLGASRAATKVSPLEALRPSDLLKNVGAGKARLIVSLVLILTGAIITVWSLWQVRLNATGHTSKASGDGAETVLGLAVLGIVLASIGILLSANRWIPLLLRGIGSLVARIGPSSAIAVANISRNRSRVAATGAALLIGVTLVSTLATGAASAKLTMAGILDQQYSVDVQISADGLDAKALDAIRHIDGVADAELVPQYAATIESGGEQGAGMTIFALDGRRIDGVLNTKVGRDLKGQGTVLLPASLMEASKGFRNGGQLGLVMLAPVQNDTDGGSASQGQRQPSSARSFTGAYAPFKGIDASRFYGLADPASLEGLHPYATQIWARTKGSPTVSVLMDEIQDALARYSAVSVQGGLAEKQQWDQRVDTLLMIMVALLAVAVVIALIGVTNTLSLSVLERRRESATLRAIGMTRKQIRWSLAVESGLIALGSTVVGVVLGLLFGWIGSYEVFASDGRVALPIPWSADAVILVVAFLAAVLASVLPARRANRMPPVVALAED